MLRLIDILIVAYALGSNNFQKDVEKTFHVIRLHASSEDLPEETVEGNKTQPSEFVPVLQTF